MKDLSKADCEKVLYLVDRFQQEWAGASDAVAGVDIEGLLPGKDDPLREATLFELIKTDMDIRGRRGQAIRLDFYAAKYADVGAVRNLPAHLVYEEYRVRQLYGDKPQLADYKQRFPMQFIQVQRLVQEQTPTVVDSIPAAAARERPVEVTPPSKKGEVLDVGGGYRLTKRLGSGSYGEVWRAEAPGGIEVAVKRIFRPLDHADARRELASLELIKGLRHPFLLQTQSFFALEDRLIIIMELADGSLLDRLKECQKGGMAFIPAAELMSYFQETAEALDFLHSKKVIHRDVKPENILLLQRHAKVADFGLARIQESQHRATGSTAGTPSYMAPEVWRGKADNQSDQYSLALTYAELRLGRRLLSSSDMMELMLEHLERSPNLGDLPKAEQEVLHKAMAKTPDKRYRSCKEFVNELMARVLAPPAAQAATTPVRSRADDYLPPQVLHTQQKYMPASSEPSSAAQGSSPGMRSIFGCLLGASAGLVLWTFYRHVNSGKILEETGLAQNALLSSTIAMLLGAMAGTMYAASGRIPSAAQVGGLALLLLGGLVGACQKAGLHPSSFEVSLVYDGASDHLAGLACGAFAGAVVGAVLAWTLRLLGTNLSKLLLGAVVGAIAWGVLKARWVGTGTSIMSGGQIRFAANALHFDLQVMAMAAVGGAILGILLGELFKNPPPRQKLRY